MKKLLCVILIFALFMQTGTCLMSSTGNTELYNRGVCAQSLNINENKQEDIRKREPYSTSGYSPRQKRKKMSKAKKIVIYIGSIIASISAMIFGTWFLYNKKKNAKLIKADKQNELPGDNNTVNPNLTTSKIEVDKEITLSNSLNSNNAIGDKKSYDYSKQEYGVPDFQKQFLNDIKRNDEMATKLKGHAYDSSAEIVNPGIYDCYNISEVCTSFLELEEDDSSDYNYKYESVLRKAVEQCNKNIRVANTMKFFDSNKFMYIKNIHKSGETFIDCEGKRRTRTRKDIITEIAFCILILDDIIQNSGTASRIAVKSFNLLVSELSLKSNNQSKSLAEFSRMTETLYRRLNFGEFIDDDSSYDSEDED